MKIRTRLTLLYGCAFFVAGAVLVALTLFYLRQSLDHQPGSGAAAVVRQFLEERGPRNRPILDELFTAVSTEAEQQRRETMRAMVLWSLVSLGVVGVAAAGLGWLLAGRALQPLQEVTATARRVADRSLHERIALVGPDDEIKELADTFDAMLERLDRAFDGQHRFVANASHELRTPLTINRTLIEVALADPDAADSTRNLGKTLLEVNQRHERLIDGLLVLASSEQQLTEHTRFDLAAAAHRAVQTSEDQAHHAGVRVRTDLAPTWVIGDPTLIERVAHNLVDNAIRYNLSEGGWVSIAVQNAGQTARLVVMNSGPVVPPAEAETLFEPFRRRSHTDRVPAVGGGAGLGLSIVRAVATAHHGHARAWSRPEGGLVVEVTLPAVQ